MIHNISNPYLEESATQIGFFFYRMLLPPFDFLKVFFLDYSVMQSVIIFSYSHSIRIIQALSLSWILSLCMVGEGGRSHLSKLKSNTILSPWLPPKKRIRSLCLREGRTYCVASVFHPYFNLQTSRSCCYV